LNLLSYHIIDLHLTVVNDYGNVKVTNRLVAYIIGIVIKKSVLRRSKKLNNADTQSEK